eukprot:CCRYP_002036-RD/>CCRYP_002036-RD protein AED:0.49 eAED:1.00 QI:0/0/0/1/0/0/2/0/68
MTRWSAVRSRSVGAKASCCFIRKLQRKREGTGVGLLFDVRRIVKKSLSHHQRHYSPAANTYPSQPKYH